MQNLVETFPGPGDLVLDKFAGTPATAKAGLELPRSRRFVGCRADADRFVPYVEELVDACARQVSKEK